MSRAQHVIPLKTIERRIYVIRDHKVMMDRDLAELYGKWLRVLDTAERSQVDQHVRQQFHAVVSLLDAFKAEQ